MLNGVYTQTGELNTRETERDDRLLQIEPTQPFAWKSVPEENHPFTSPRDEYIRSRFSFTPAQLAWRWQDLAPRHEIELLFNDPRLLGERMATQWMMTQNAELPDIDDVGWRKNLLTLRILAVEEQMKQIDHALTDGRTKRTEWVPSEDGFGGSYEEKWRELSVRDAAILRKEWRECSKHLELLQGNATEITKTQIDVTVTSEERKQALIELREQRMALMEGDIDIQVFGKGEAPVRESVEAEVVA